jgi:hypothetical protein
VTDTADGSPVLLTQPQADCNGVDRAAYQKPVIPSGVSRRLFFAFASCERVGSRREESLFDFSDEASFFVTALDSNTKPIPQPQIPNRSSKKFDHSKNIYLFERQNPL